MLEREKWPPVSQPIALQPLKYRRILCSRFQQSGTALDDEINRPNRRSGTGANSGGTNPSGSDSNSGYGRNSLPRPSRSGVDANCLLRRKSPIDSGCDISNASNRHNSRLSELALVHVCQERLARPLGMRFRWPAPPKRQARADSQFGNRTS